MGHKSKNEKSKSKTVYQFFKDAKMSYNMGKAKGKEDQAYKSITKIVESDYKKNASVQEQYDSIRTMTNTAKNSTQASMNTINQKSHRGGYEDRKVGFMEKLGRGTLFKDDKAKRRDLRKEAVENIDQQREALASSKSLQEPEPSLSKNIWGIKPDLPGASSVASAAEKFQDVTVNRKVPAFDANFMKNAGALNAEVMTAYKEYLAALTHAMESLAGGVGDTDFTDAGVEHMQSQQSIQEKLSPENEQLLTQYLKTSYQLKSQEIGLNNIYDVMVTAYRNKKPDDNPLANKSYSDLFKESKLYTINENKATRLGGGMINTVYRTNEEGNDGVFKPGFVHATKAQDMSGVLITMGLKNRMLEKGPVQIKDLNSSYRDVAVSRVDKLFGFDVITNTRLAQKKDGGAASLMDLAKGKTANDYHAYDETQILDIGTSLTGIDWKTATDLERKTIKQKGLEEYTKVINLSKKKEAELQIENALDLSDPQFVVQALQLQIIDQVVGHADRHTANYMIHKNMDKDGNLISLKLTGIDNDTSFGSANMNEIQGHKLGALASVFPFITDQLFTRVNEVTPSDLEQMLTGLLSPTEIEGAVVRLNNLKAHFAKLKDEYQVKETLTKEDGHAFAGKNAETSIQKNPIMGDLIHDTHSARPIKAGLNSYNTNKKKLLKGQKIIKR